MSGPTREEALGLIGLLNEGKLAQAVQVGEQLAARYPQSAILCNMVGSALVELGQRAEAVNWYGRAFRLQPGDVGTAYNLGITLQELGRKEEAIACYGHILQLKPDHDEVRAMRLYQQAQICDWAAVEAQSAAIAELGVAGAAVPTFAMLGFEDHPARHRTRSERFAVERHGQPSLGDFVRPGQHPERLRIGYFSADFSGHAVARLIARTIELHDRSRFEVRAYAFGPPSEDAVRQRLVRAFDHFRDVGKLGDADIAALARADGLDVAIDLTGYTTHARTGVFAHRAAPVQISYLGYPGTMGAPFIDYIVADRMVIPEAQRAHYSESPIYLPHSYQAQDDLLQPVQPPARSELGLPEQAFVFCALHNSYKINAPLFDIWMRLLKGVDGSILWLLRVNRWAEANLRAGAERRGIDPARLIFADSVPYADYVSRLARADLFLDSFPYNAGATASNALWAGLPLITRAGEGYAARMAASLLSAIGLPDLVTETDEAYERLALALATDAAKLGAVRRRLADNRSTTPLFDSVAFTRNLEQGYARAYRRWLEAKPPGVIDIG